MSELVNLVKEVQAQEVFQINDVNFRIPPTNIAVQQEDLVYQAKSLRTSTSSKTPSGHGHCTVQVIGVATYDIMLDLHRVAVEAKNSPFVFVENRIVRETIVPSWPLTQNMAFTVIGMSIAPMPGASDAMVFQLDLQWFNYSPFTHNYYYRSEWATEWLENQDPKKQTSSVKKTIGWDIDSETFERRPRTVVIGEQSGGVGGHREYDVVADEYKNKSIRTLDDMELLHPGEFFDLLPMPDRMEPALPVSNPRDSFIYVRYANYIQRDALLINFGIDVEAELRDFGIEDYFFAVGNEAGVGAVTYPLTHVPTGSAIYKTWRSLYNSWNAKLAEHQGGAEFAFCIYKEIRMPEKWNSAVHKTYAASASKHYAQIGGEHLDDWFLRLDTIGGQTRDYVSTQDPSRDAENGQPARIRILPGISKPDENTHVPVGPADGSPSVKYALSKIGSGSTRVGWRSASTVAELYGSDSRTGRVHYGTDFGGNVGDPVYAVKPGVVRVYDQEPTVLRMVDLRSHGKLGAYPADTPVIKNFNFNNDEHMKILLDIAYTHWDEVPVTADEDYIIGEIKSGKWKDFIGSSHAYTSTRQYNGIFVWREYAAGGIWIHMDHDDGSASRYMHLSRVVVPIGTRVTEEQCRAGFKIAEMGATSGYSDARRKKMFSSVRRYVATTTSNTYPSSTSVNADTTDETDYQLSSHLHFEYWEKPTPDRMPKYTYNDGLPLVRQKTGLGSYGYVPVQFATTLERAVNQDTPNLIGTPLMPPTLRPFDLPKSDLGITEREAQAISEQIDGLLQDGWLYYDDDTSIRNVWYKVIHLDVSRGNPDVQDPNDFKYFRTDTLVLTNVGGGFRHVVSNIPVLGQEYPTQQHLGSIEPTYNFEFHSLDQHPDRDGLSSNAQVMMGMRSVLQHNARKFRPIVDGWALSCNSFITRFFGSYQEGDVRAAIRNYNGETEVDGWSLRRRLICDRATASTVEGSPGLSIHNLQMSATNPYATQGLTSTAPPLEDQETYFGRILRGIYNLDFDDRYANLREQMLIASISGAELRAVDDESYGKVRLRDPGQGRGFVDNIGFARGAPGGDFVNGNTDSRAPLYIRDTSGQYEQIFDDAGQRVTRVSVDSIGVISSDPAGDFIIVDAGATRDWQQTGGEPTKDIRTPNVSGSDMFSGRTYGAFSSESTEYGFIDYDITGVLTDSQESQLAAEIPWLRIMDLRKMIRDVLDAAEATIFENPSYIREGFVTGKALSSVKYSDGLYNLPSEPQAWRQLTYVLEKFARQYPPYNGSGGNYGLQYLYGGLDKEDVNWLKFENELPSRKKDMLSRAYDAEYKLDAFSAGVATAAGAASLLEFIPGLGWGLRLGSIALSATPFAFDKLRNPVSGTVGRVLGWAFDEVEDLINPLNSGEVLDGTKAAIASEIDNECWRLASVQSQAIPWAGGAITYLDGQVGAIAKSFIEPIFGNLGRKAGADGEDTASALASYTRRLRDSVNSSGMIGVGAIDGMPSMMIPAGTFGADFRNTAFRLGGDQGYDVNLPYKKWEWYVDINEEERKLEYYKGILSRIARFAADDAGVMRALGLEFEARAITTPRLKGTPAYPDIVLPWHPYYGSLERVSPDFYMWNMYQDGRLFGKGVQDDMERVLNHVVANSYQGMLKLQRETGVVKPGQGVVDLENYPESVVGFQPEGHDGSVKGNFGPSTDAFYSIPQDNDHINRFFKAMSAEQGEGNDGKSEVPSSIVPTSTVQNLKSRRAKGLRAGRAEGYFGGGGGVQYEARGNQEQYDTLKAIWDGFENESMFGHRAGFLQQKEGLDTSRLDNTVLGEPSAYKHSYSLSELQQIARQSSKDLRTHKMMMRRAYPTFKLYFIEEDEYETRLLNFDDFYSYNGVVSFTVVQDRKDAADHAIITVQNISGTLDGTKRNVVTDLDYFVDETSTGRARSGDDPSRQGSDADQPFGAVVLRPGLNVQLRAGFSNNPEELEVLINGRVVDVTWNKQMDQAEIMVQSFGVELIQDVKGSAISKSIEDEEPFYTTHELLGSMMMEPELTHFGRWEFATRPQYGEDSNYTLDFNDYSGDSFLSKFSWSTWAVSAMLDHPLLTGAIVIAGSAGLSRVGGNAWGVRNVLTWATRGNGAVAKMLTKKGVTAPINQAAWRSALIDAAVARGGTRGAVNGASKIALPVVKQALESNQNLTQIIAAVRHAGGDALAVQTKLDVTRSVTRASLEGIETIDEFAEILAGSTAGARTAVIRGQWFLDPVVTNQSSIFGALEGLGGRPVVRAGWRYLSETPKYLVTAAGLGLGFDAISEFIIDPIMSNTVGRAERYWKVAKSRIMIAPQDDNLFVPHPKDYMVIPDKTWTETWKGIKDWVVYTGSRSLFFLGDSDARGVARFLNGDIMDKRVSPDAAQYRPFNTRIWDIFHEMSLRHPGWIYGTRPYGKEFRYTMFFGVPSQRYWSRPGRSEFVDRVNTLYDMIKSGYGISKNEYRRLYGDSYEGQNLDEYDDTLLTQAIRAVSRERSVTTVVDPDGNAASVVFDHAVSPDPSDPEVQKKYQELQQHSYGAKALEEYLLGIETRFTPFRRYHSLQSDRDIVWNGIMGTENATYNAVDVTYWPEDGGDQPDGTAFFKAHGRIAPHKLRVRPLQHYRNVRGYQMAMRYAMGQMLHDMREMYRGDMIILGNPRIRPWDICILQDSYNDMAGPFEVERVVHTFSHETGYITELKPGALVIANEISGYPMLTAMKMMTLAIEDLQQSYVGLQHGVLDATKRFYNAQLSAGNSLNVSALAKEVSQAVREEYPNGFSQAVADGDLPDPKVLEDATDDLYNLALILGGVGALSVAALTYHGVGAVLKASPASIYNKRPILTQVGATLAAGSITLLGEAAVSASILNKVSPLTIMWLLGGPLLMLNCLRGDSVIFVPLMKSGEPIAPSFSYRDPTAVWNDFKGEINRYIDDYVSGTREVLDLYRLYGTAAWREVPDLNMLSPFAPSFGNALKGEEIVPGDN